MPLIYLQKHQTPAAAFTTRLFAWGLNISGQLGQSNLTNRSSPVPVPSGSWAALSTYGNHTLAIKTNGTLWAWGDNSFGQLGDSTTISRSSPVQIGASLWSMVSAGAEHSIGLTLGFPFLMYVWGRNNFGQLGDSTTVNRASPTLLSSQWARVAAGQYHTASIGTPVGRLGQLFMWGKNTSGQLGLNDTVNRSSPVSIGTSSWACVGLGNEHSGATLGVVSGSVPLFSSLYMWGSNSSGQLGDNTTINRSSPVLVAGGGQWTFLSCGQNYTVARNVNATIYSWGANAGGELGQNDTVARSSPTQIGALAGWDAIVASANHSSVGGFTLATRYDGSKWAWGRNTTGEHADGTSGNTTSSPVQVGSTLWTLPIPMFTAGFADPVARAHSAGSSHSVGIRGEPSTLFGWGAFPGETLGDGATIPRVSPVQVGIPTDVPNGSWSAVSAALDHILGIKTDGSLWSWGDNADGQLGTSGNFQRVFPIKIGSSSWTAIAAGYTFSLGLRIDGALFAWGINSSGQLGLGDVVARSSPVQVGGSSWSVVAAGAFHSGAIRSDGRLFMWGFGGNGCLGDGTSASKSSPVMVAAPFATSSWTAVAVNQRTSAAITLDDNLFVWGDGSQGQIGNGATPPVNTVPVLLVGGADWLKVSLAPKSVAAIRTDGRLFTWGYNGQGLLGDGTVISRSLPVQIPGSWISVDAALSPGDADFEGHMIAVRTGGTLWAWGANNVGQLAQNDLSPRSSPTQIGTHTFWAGIISSGLGNSFAIRS